MKHTQRALERSALQEEYVEALRPFLPSPHDREWSEWQEFVARKIASIFGISLQELGVVVVEGEVGEQAQITSHKE